MAEVYTQLVMRKKLGDERDAAVPDGFVLRGFQDGDEAAWNYMVGDMCAEGFDKAIRSHRFFRPERVKMICLCGKPVSTATAWSDRHGDETQAMVHKL